MKQDWYPDELTQHWTLSAEERELLDTKTSATRLSFALLLKAFQFDGRFPDRHENKVFQYRWALRHPVVKEAITRAMGSRFPSR